MKGTLFFVALAVYFASSSAIAWGPLASKFICHDAVKFVWGPEAVTQCLLGGSVVDYGGLCDASYRVLGEDYEAKCVKALSNGSWVHPSTLSDEVFGDVQNHVDFSRCPINSGGERWVCGNPDDRPAYNISERWFSEAESASSLCERVYYFCVGASYYADSESTLHQVRYLANDCVKNIEEGIDVQISNGLSDWGSSQTCRFDNGVQGNGHNSYKQRMGESSSTLNRIVANLTDRGNRLRSSPYRPGGGVVLLANSIDLGLSSNLVEYLNSNGIKVIISNSSEFERLKYNNRIIILGGQNSPEGVGEISSKLLSQEAEASLLTGGRQVMLVRGDVWEVGQKVILLAGSEAADTARASDANKEHVLEEVKSGGVT